MKHEENGGRFLSDAEWKARGGIPRDPPRKVHTVILPKSMTEARTEDETREYPERIAELEKLLEYVQHKPTCWKRQAHRGLGAGGDLASCTCGLDELLRANEP